MTEIDKDLNKPDSIPSQVKSQKKEDLNDQALETKKPKKDKSIKKQKTEKSKRSKTVKYDSNLSAPLTHADMPAQAGLFQNNYRDSNFLSKFLFIYGNHFVQAV